MTPQPLPRRHQAFEVDMGESRGWGWPRHNSSSQSGSPVHTSRGPPVDAHGGSVSEGGDQLAAFASGNTTIWLPFAALSSTHGAKADMEMLRFSEAERSKLPRGANSTTAARNAGAVAAAPRRKLR